MEESELQMLVEKISIEYFSKPFKHKARFNHRLRTTGGRYLTKSHHLEFNRNSYEKYGLDELIGIIKHELCHYHLHLQGKGYLHRDASFKDCLKMTKGSRFAKTLHTNQQKKPAYILKCDDCHFIYYRKRKMDPAKYRCGKCGGRLTLGNC